MTSPIPTPHTAVDILRAAREKIAGGSALLEALSDVSREEAAFQLLRRALAEMPDGGGTREFALAAFDRAITLAEQSVQS